MPGTPLLRDARYGARALLRSPGFALAALAALVLGVGASAPVLTLLRGDALRRLAAAEAVGAEPVHEADWRAGWTAELRAPARIRHDGVDALLAVLEPLAWVVLGVACINLLLLGVARGATRGHEMSLRAALGAGRGRLAGQLLTEGGMLALAGGAGGALAGAAALPLLGASLPAEPAGWPTVAGAPGGLALALAATLGVALACSLLPLRAAGRPDLFRPLTVGGRATPGRHEGAARRALGVVAVAASLVLLTVAGLLMRGSGAVAGDAEPGLDPRGVLTARLDASREGGTERRAALQREALARVQALPGARGAALGSPGAWTGVGAEDRVKVVCGVCYMAGALLPVVEGTARHHAVSPGAFGALGVPLVEGRDLAPADTAGVVINRTFANRLFPGSRERLGKKIRVGEEWYTVVGVVADVRARGVGSGSRPDAALYLSALRHPPPVAELAVRAEGSPRLLLPAVRGAVAGPGTGPTLRDAATLEEVRERLLAPLRWFAALFAGLAAVAVALSAAGLYGVIAHGVARRTREIGVRVALGARTGEVVRLVMGESLRLVALGAALGLIGALSLARLLQLLFHGVDPLDPVVYGTLALLLAAVAGAASALPARRAARVDPVVALRAE